MMEWPEILGLAEALRAADGSAVAACGESRLRAAVGRAYYAVFCVARDRLEGWQGRSFEPYDVHESVIRAMKDLAWRRHELSGRTFEFEGQRWSASEFVRRLALRLRNLHHWRIQADYHALPCTQRQADEAVSLARRLLSAIDQIRAILDPA